MEAAPCASEKRLWVGLAVFALSAIACNIAFHDTGGLAKSGLRKPDADAGRLPPEAETEAAGESDAQRGQTGKNHAAAMRAPARESLEAKGFRAVTRFQIAGRRDLARIYQGCEILNVRVAGDEAQNGKRSSNTGQYHLCADRCRDKSVFPLCVSGYTGIKVAFVDLGSANLLSNHEWDGAYGGRVFCEQGGKL